MNWTICPDCGWSYERNGDTHMSTRFNCARSRSSVLHPPSVETVAQLELPWMSEADADRQTAAVVWIMVKQQLNFGPACDVYIEQQRQPPQRDLFAEPREHWTTELARRAGA